MARTATAIAIIALTASLASAQPASNSAGYEWTPFAQQKAASSFADIHDFTPSCYYGLAAPMFVGKTLYGVLNLDSNLDVGCVFSLVPNGAKPAAYKELHAFGGQEATGDANNSHGQPVQIGDFLYDTGFAGGKFGNGVVFRFSLKTHKDEVLHSFDELASGGSPPTGLGADSVGDLFGVANEGDTRCGDLGCGLVFEMVLDRKTGKYSYHILHKFSQFNDGNTPLGAPVVFNRVVYGTTSAGGKYGNGTVYELTVVNGKWHYTVIHQFTGKKDGAASQSSLTVHDGKLYGTTRFGGKSFGVVFEMTPPTKSHPSWMFRTLHEFATSPDGAGPLTAPVFAKNGTLYGVTGFGGNHFSDGTIYSISPAGHEAVLYAFPEKAHGTQDWGTPSAGVVFGPDGRLYGLIVAAGKHGYGYAFSFQP